MVMRVQDLMTTEVVTLEACDSLDLVDDIMRLGRVRHMPVLSDGRLVGLVSQRDLFRAGISSVLHFRRAAEQEWLARISVREVMTPGVFTIQPDAPIGNAIDIMLAKHIGCLPVVDGDKVVGILSETDCLRHLARVLARAEDKVPSPGLPLAT
jgi:acetoin utilization protein AcuB